MTTILHISSSSNLQSSLTRKFGKLTVEKLQKTHSGSKIIKRDLVQDTVPHLSPAFVEARNAGDEAAKIFELSNQLIDEVMASDILVIEAPMYNFNIPSVLKAWFDHILRAGKTFKYGATGPEGLVKNKKVFLILSSGGVYSEGPAKGFDHNEPYLRTLLGFIGVTDIEVIRTEGVARGPDKIAATMAQAEKKIEALAA
jgi:FMN-dependent NADH-azoreductase